MEIEENYKNIFISKETSNFIFLTECFISSSLEIWCILKHGVSFLINFDLK